MMKTYNSLFPSYYFRDDDAPVYFQTSSSSISLTVDDNENLAHAEEVLFSTITGSSELVNLLKRAKAISNSFGRKTFEELRGKTNYYEGLGKGCFLNRSAMKLVNLDYVFSLIEPSLASYTTSSSLSASAIKTTKNMKNENNEIELKRRETERPHFSFVDLCGGPGGFIECITLKCRHLGTAVTGFGMTLLIGDEEPGFRGIMKACNWNILHLQDPPYSVVLSDRKRVKKESEFDQKHDQNDSTQNHDKENKISDKHESGNVIPQNVLRTEDENSESECRIFLVDGPTGTGDICVKENLNSLCTLLQAELPVIEYDEKTKQNNNDNIFSEKKLYHSAETEKISEKRISNNIKYVSFVCSDGFDHETEAFRIVLCQVIGMIKTLKIGGNFIMKIFSCTKVLFFFVFFRLLIYIYILVFYFVFLLLWFFLFLNYLFHELSIVPLSYITVNKNLN